MAILPLIALAVAMLPAGVALAAPLVVEDISGDATAEDMVAALVGGEVAVSNVTYVGAEVAAGFFTGGSDVVGFESGIILSSGSVANVVGPNDEEGVTTANGTVGDTDLDTLSGGTTLDASVLEFDFVPGISTVSFDYVFGSDEYNEYVNSAFNDVFGFFVNGENCALVEGEPVSINTINNGNPFGTEPNSNPEYYINNDIASGAALDTEMDGLTVVLTCTAPVTPGVDNHIKLAIADTADSILDAAVFLSAASFEANLPEVNFWSFLSGADEVTTSGLQAVDSDGSAVAGMSVNDGETAVDVNLITFGLEDIVAAHIHCGIEGANGPVGATLFGGGPVTQDGLLVETTITEPNAGNECGWATLDDMIEALRSLGAYVNVHTTAYPDGEVRGQIQATAMPIPPSGSFTDDDANVHEGNIEAIAGPGITRGCNPPDNTLYCPSDEVTRGQMAAFLNRALNLPDAPTDLFGDDAGHVFETDINAIAAVGITLGCNPPANTNFCPDDAVTRGQMAAFLVRALALTDPGSTDFADDNGSVFEADIEKLAAAEITLGCNPPANTNFCPDDTVKRDQMGSFFARFLGFEEIAP